jgi:prephenate dehydratase
MVANIQISNSNFTKVLEDHKKNLDELAKIVKSKDKNKLEKAFIEISSKFAELNSEMQLKQAVQKFDKKAIVILGPKGSFTDAACSFYLKNKPAKKIYSNSVSEIIEAVKKGKVKQGIVPIENSIQGTVTEVLDGINYSGISIAKAVVIPVHHCGAILSGKKVNTILSHPQALMQCSKFISRNYPNASLISTLSTSEAFQKIVREGMENAMAIGPKIAAELYGLNILKENIENEKNNKTMFFVIRRKAESVGNKVTISIFPYHEKQGLLFNLLRFFNEKKINLTKIESRPMQDKLGKYIFYITIEGNIKNKDVRQALANIEKSVGKVKVMGCYSTIEARI